MASAAARRSPRTSVRSLASIATSVPVPMARPRSAWASAAASLTPSPTIATTSALRPAGARRRRPCRRAAPRRSRRGRCRPAPATARGGPALSPVSRIGRSPSSRSARSPLPSSASRCRRRRAARGARRPSPRQTTVRPAASAAARGVVERASVATPLLVDDPGATSDDDGVAVDHAPHAEPLGARERRQPAGSPPRAGPSATTARAIGCSEASSTAAGEPQHLVRDPPVGGDDVDDLHPARRSPCRSCRAGSCRCGGSTPAPPGP